MQGLLESAILEQSSQVVTDSQRRNEKYFDAESDKLDQWADEVGEKKSLLDMCSAFRARDVQNFTSLTIKKIPKTVLTWCEWGKDDYSLEIKNLAAIQSSDSEPIESVASTRRSRKARAKTSDQPTLFDLGS